MTGLLNKISEIINDYQNHKGVTVDDLMGMQRELTTSIYHLTKYQVDYHTEWLAKYHSFEGTNAGKERYADNACQGLYACRKIIDAANNVSIAISQELRIMNKDK